MPPSSFLLAPAPSSSSLVRVRRASCPLPSDLPQLHAARNTSNRLSSQPWTCNGPPQAPPRTPPASSAEPHRHPHSSLHAARNPLKSNPQIAPVPLLLAPGRGAVQSAAAMRCSTAGESHSLLLAS
uniref:Uncharacterized protein n=1 Tax=Arundo donax TaxID=35708 RepID=A0A0A9BDL8_ARUDO